MRSTITIGPISLITISSCYDGHMVNNNNIRAMNLLATRLSILLPWTAGCRPARTWRSAWNDWARVTWAVQTQLLASRPTRSAQKQEAAQKLVAQQLAAQQLVAQQLAARAIRKVLIIRLVFFFYSVESSLTRGIYCALRSSPPHLWDKFYF